MLKHWEADGKGLAASGRQTNYVMQFDGTRNETTFDDVAEDSGGVLAPNFYVVRTFDCKARNFVWSSNNKSQNISNHHDTIVKNYDRS